MRAYTIRLPNNDGLGTAIGTEVRDPDGKTMESILEFRLEGRVDDVMSAWVRVPVRVEVEHTVSVKLEMPR